MSGGAVVVLGDQSASSDTDDKRGAPLRPRAYTTGLISQLQSILAAGGPDGDSATDTAPTLVRPRQVLGGQTNTTHSVPDPGDTSQNAGRAAASTTPGPTVPEATLCRPSNPDPTASSTDDDDLADIRRRSLLSSAAAKAKISVKPPMKRAKPTLQKRPRHRSNSESDLRHIGLDQDESHSHSGEPQSESCTDDGEQAASASENCAESGSSRAAQTAAAAALKAELDALRRGGSTRNKASLRIKPRRPAKPPSPLPQSEAPSAKAAVSAQPHYAALDWSPEQKNRPIPPKPAPVNYSAVMDAHALPQPAKTDTAAASPAGTDAPNSELIAVVSPPGSMRRTGPVYAEPQPATLSEGIARRLDLLRSELDSHRHVLKASKGRAPLPLPTDGGGAAAAAAALAAPVREGLASLNLPRVCFETLDTAGLVTMGELRGLSETTLIADHGLKVGHARKISRFVEKIACETAAAAALAKSTAALDRESPPPTPEVLASFNNIGSSGVGTAAQASPRGTRSFVAMRAGKGASLAATETPSPLSTIANCEAGVKAQPGAGGTRKFAAMRGQQRPRTAEVRTQPAAPEGAEATSTTPKERRASAPDALADIGDCSVGASSAPRPSSGGQRRFVAVRAQKLRVAQESAAKLEAESCTDDLNGSREALGPKMGAEKEGAGAKASPRGAAHAEAPSPDALELISQSRVNKASAPTGTRSFAALKTTTEL